MADYFIQKMDIYNLWGNRNLHLEFQKDVNIIIGPNASGKTTILNLLRYISNVDIVNLHTIEFGTIYITLKSFNGRSSRKISVQTTENGYKFNVARQVFEVDIEPILRYETRNSPSNLRLPSRYRIRYAELEMAIKEIIHAVWLPVSRRLPIPDDEEMRAPSGQLESVDVRLRELIKDIQTYRLGLEQKLSQRYKDFEKSVLREILYSKKYDQLGTFSGMEMPTPNDKNQLIRAFQVAGLLDATMQKRIDEHFDAANKALVDFTEINKSAGGNQKISLEFLFILPLIRRTKTIIQNARGLEEDRNSLFEPLHKFESLANSFLQPKTVSLQDNGELIIHSPLQPNIQPHMLSSGEKQILILLIQALVREAEPVIYVADEPELSLHVTWQENLLKSLMQLSKQIQIIVATHSPDIVGPYTERIIDLGKMP